MPYFDLHVHPSLKGSLTIDPKLHNAWASVPLNNKKLTGVNIFFHLALNLLANTGILLLNLLLNGIPWLWHYLNHINFPREPYQWKWYFHFKLMIKGGWVHKLKQIFISQANLTHLASNPTLAVIALIAIEKAFAESKILNTYLTKISPLDRKLLFDVIEDRKTYFEMFERDLRQLEEAQRMTYFDIRTNMDHFNPDSLNIILSVEGAHSFQGTNEASILTNLDNYKRKYPKYRFHHLTLTHLTRQPACVHCLGTRVKLLQKDMVPNLGFRPDPSKIGISPLGIGIICLAYHTEPYRILIDIKHMSYVSRQQFYQFRRKNHLTDIPLIASHAGVTGCTLKDARIRKIKKAKEISDCDEVFWYKRKSESDTPFNPWTINLFDEDIEEILKSGGMIGIILEERVLGVGDIYGEFMSPKEVNALGLHHLIPKTADFNPELAGYNDSFEAPLCTKMDADEILKSLPAYQISSDIPFNGILTGDMLFDLDKQPKPPSHLDTLACNIIHVLKVGLTKGYDGHQHETDVTKCICIGSDLDGIMDPMNFPEKRGGNSVNQKDWVIADKLPRLKAELIQRLARCLANDSIMNGRIKDIPDLVEKIFYTNGYEFLKKHFN